MSEASVGREEQQPFPAYVASPEQQRRWELATRAVLITYGFNPDDPNETLDRGDRQLLLMAVPTVYLSTDFETGDGSVTDQQREAMRAMGAL